MHTATSSLFFFALTQSKRVVARNHLLILRLASVKLNHLILQLLAVFLDLLLLLRVLFLQLIKLGMQVLFGFLQFGLLHLDTDNKHLPHLVLLLLELLQMVRSFVFESLLEADRFVVCVYIAEPHLFEASFAVELVVARVRLFAHVLHVGADQHFA